MSKTSMLEKDLSEVQCYDLSIQTLPNGKSVLILICKQKAESTKLNNILHQHAFDLIILIDSKTKNYSLEFQFLDSDIGFRFDTGKVETDYPPLQKLKNNQITYITTGVWTGKTQKGRSCDYNSRLKRLGQFNIGDSFQQAIGIQFIAGDSDKDPSIIVLTYSDYDHIFLAEADEAYNRLLDMSVSQPTLEITPVGLQKVNLRIWDILVDLDVRFEGLNYSETQLEKFLERTGENDSFAFALGFTPIGNTKAALASTKKEGFELITLHGLIYRK